MNTSARNLSPEEHAQGFSVCPCGKFAYVVRSALLAQLPRGYYGELCPECSLWLCSVDKLREAGFDVAPNATRETT